MARIITEDFEFEFKFERVEQWVIEEMLFTVNLTRKGKNIINYDLLRKDKFYSYYDFSKNDDPECPLHDFKKALTSKEPIVWEKMIEEDMCICIFPHRWYPNLCNYDEKYYTIIFSPNIEQYKGSDCYGGYDGVSFVITPTYEEFAKFVQDLEAEYNQLLNSFITTKY